MMQETPKARSRKAASVSSKTPSQKSLVKKPSSAAADDDDEENDSSDQEGRENADEDLSDEPIEEETMQMDATNILHVSKITRMSIDKKRTNIETWKESANRKVGMQAREGYEYNQQGLKHTWHGTEEGKPMLYVKRGGEYIDEGLKITMTAEPKQID